jgi:hypothetical protein
MRLEFSPQSFEKYSNIKFHSNPSKGSQAVPCRQTDMKKLMLASHNHENTPKNVWY